MKRSYRNATWATAAAVVLLGGASLLLLTPGCGQSNAQSNASSKAGDSPETTDRPASRVETVTVERRDLVQTVEMPGSVEGFETADLYAKVGGYLREFAIHPETGQPIDLGDRVYKGQELAYLDIPEMEKQPQQRLAAVNQAEAEVEQSAAAIAQAKANLESVHAALDEAKAERAEKQAQIEYRQTEYDRFRKLVEAQSVQRELLDAAKYQLDIAQAMQATVEARIRTADAKLSGAKADLEKGKADHRTAQARLRAAQADVDYVETLMQYATITAPFDGVVTKRWVHSGAFIQPAEGNSGAQPLLTVTRADVVRVFIDVPMNDVRLLNRGDRAVLSRINVLPGHEVEGEVTRFSGSLENASRMMRVEIDLPNPDGRLLPGYYGYVTVYLEEMKDTPVIPSSALLGHGSEKYVYVCEDGRARKCVVTTCYQDGAWIGIESGLQGGEQIIGAGGGQVQDGDPVELARAG